MGNCAGLCEGDGTVGDPNEHQMRQSFNHKDMNTNGAAGFANRDFEKQFEDAPDSNSKNKFFISYL